MRYFFRTLGMALKALTRNPMRTILTTLGVIMGVAAVIAIREIGQGASKSMQDTIASMGSNILLVLPGAATPQGASTGAGGVVTLTPDDADALSDPNRCPSVIAVAPHRPRPAAGDLQQQELAAQHHLRHHAGFLASCATGTRLTDGIPFGDQDVASQAEVCLLGQTVVKQLFDGRRRITSRRSARRSASTTSRSRWWASSAPRAPTCSARTRTTSSWRRGRR